MSDNSGEGSSKGPIHLATKSVKRPSPAAPPTGNPLPLPYLSSKSASKRTFSAAHPPPSSSRTANPVPPPAPNAAPRPYAGRPTSAGARKYTAMPSTVHLANNAYRSLYSNTAPSVQPRAEAALSRKVPEPDPNPPPQPRSSAPRKTIDNRDPYAPPWQDVKEQIESSRISRRPGKAALGSARMRTSMAVRQPEETVSAHDTAFVSILRSGQIKLRRAGDEEEESDNARPVLRTKQTRRRSTGGKAPRFQMASKSQPGARKTSTAAVMSARKNEEYKSSGESSASESESEEEETGSSDGSGAPDDSDDDEESDEDDGERSAPQTPSMAIEPLLQSSPIQARPAPEPSTRDPSEALCADLRRLTIPVHALQKARRLPFLRRDLRKGFLAQSASKGFDVQASGEPGVNARRYFCTYRRAADQDDAHCVEMDGLQCPLCMLHGVFPSFALVKQHLRWDHHEVSMTASEHLEWCMLNLSIPDEPRPEEIRRSTPPLLRTAEEQIAAQTADSPPPSPKPEPRSPSPVRWEPPQAAVDPLGPQILQPDGSIPLPGGQYSCRPGGTRLYDLLHTDARAPDFAFDYEKAFGVLAWQVIEKEEEMYETDEVADEYKVMHVLWMRWIFVNRNLFISDYAAGVKTFITDNHEMIRLAAGWRAMRYWLLILLGNRFITGHDVAYSLLHYEKTVGMEKP